MKKLLSKGVGVPVAALHMVFSTAFIQSAYAQSAPSLPGPAEIDRITPQPPRIIDVPRGTEGVTREAPALSSAPEGAENIRFQLKSLRIEGVTAFDEKALKKQYAPYEGKEINLAKLWRIAENITLHYRNAGYFLSRAYVPAQEIEDGKVTIKMVEGYVAKVVLDDKKIARQRIVHQLTQQLLRQKPIKSEALESILLRLNDLPGYDFAASLEPLENAPDGAVMLRLRPAAQKGIGQVSVDNHGSRFLGPYQGLLYYEKSLVPFQQTSMFLSGSLPADEIKYVSLRHEVPLVDKWSMEWSGTYVTAQPGYTLEVNDIESQSVTLGGFLNYQPVRQRKENLTFHVGIEGKNVHGDALNAALTRDRIRVLRSGMKYDRFDHLGGYNDLSVSLTQGIDAIGAGGRENPSRAEARPDFTKAEFNFSRQQPIGYGLAAIGGLAGQLASAPLYSAEEFGYGGYSFGRAYDPSEITGDHGLSASLEVRYPSLLEWKNMQFTPSVFYDVGKVWNEDRGQGNASGSSAGIGVYASHTSGIAGSFFIAQPLTREIDTPIYGNGKNPRYLFQLSYQF